MHNFSGIEMATLDNDSKEANKDNTERSSNAVIENFGGELNENELIQKINEKDEINEASPKKKGFLSKICAEDSFISGVFNLTILSLGTGTLSLPQKVGIFSLCFSPIFIALAGLANWWSLLLISAMSDKYQIRNYSQLVFRLFGTSMSKALDGIILLNQYGYIVLYQVIIYKLLGGVINDFGKYGYPSLDDFLKKSFWRKYYFKFPIIFGIGALILLPICLLKDVSKMGKFSTIGMMTLFLLILIIIGESPLFIRHYFKEIYVKEDESTHLNVYNIDKGFNSDMDFLKAIATLFYAYSCQSGALPLVNSLKDQSKKNVDKTFTVAIIIDVIAYLIVGMLGYLTQPVDTPDLIIERKSIFKSDWIMDIGRLAFVVTLCPKICTNYNVFRCSLLTLLKYDTKKFPDWLNWTITLAFLITTGLIAALYQSISDYISLIGSFCSIVISMLIPGLCYIKGNDYKVSHWKNIMTIILVTILSIFGICSGSFTIKGIIEKSKGGD